MKASAPTSFARRALRAVRASGGQAALFLLFGMSAPHALADCSRPIVVPASALGRMMVVQEDAGTVTGIYPELLREYGKAVGCTFEFPIVGARARAEQLMSAGGMDLFVGAARNPARDAWGRFVPLMEVQWMLVSVAGSEPPTSVRDLLGQPRMRFNAVRGYNLGPEYMAMLESLSRKHALEYVVDPITVVRKMEMGRADYSVMPAGTLLGALDAAAATPDFRKRVRLSSLVGLPRAVTGIYLSRALREQDQLTLRRMFDRMTRDGALLARVHQELPAAESSTYRLVPSGH